MSIIAYDAGLNDGKEEVKTEILDIIQMMLINPPESGDIALTTLRRAIIDRWH